MRLRNIPAMILAAALLLPAADFWTAREPGEWSEQEIKRMVTDSPWAKEANVHVKGNAGAIPGPGSGRAGAAVPDNGPEAPVDAAGGAPAVPHIVVRWDSAVPVCEACANGGMERHLFSCTSKLLYLSGLSRKFEELAKEFYIVSLSNYPWRGSGAPQHSAAANAALERLGQRIQQATFLKRKGKNPVHPARVVALPAGQALLLMIFFPRTEALALDDKEVSFESADGTIEVRSKFDLRKMVYKGKLEL
jgi:hypothetical protein